MKLLILVALAGLAGCVGTHAQDQAYQYLAAYDDAVLEPAESAVARRKRGAVEHGAASSYVESSSDYHDGYDPGYGRYDGEPLQHLPVPVPVAVPQPVIKHVVVPHPVPVAITVPVPVPLPYPVHVVRTVAVPVEKPVPFPVEKPVPYPVEKPYPVTVEKRVPFAVPKPYPVHVPVYKIIYKEAPPKDYHHSPHEPNHSLHPHRHDPRDDY